MDGDESNKKVILTVQMPRDLRDRLEDLAERRMSSLSQVVREILARHVEAGHWRQEMAETVTVSTSGEEGSNGPDA